MELDASKATIVIDMDFEKHAFARAITVDALLDGNGEPLANYLERGGDLDDDQRRALVDYLRDRSGRRRGNRRRAEQIAKETVVCSRLRLLRSAYVNRTGRRRGSLEWALKTYEELHPDLDVDRGTLVKWLRREKAELRLDLARGEYTAERLP